MGTAFWRLFVVIFLVLILGNLLFLDWMFVRERNENIEWRKRTEAAENLAEVIFKQQRGEAMGATPTPVQMTECDSACQAEIARQVNLVVSEKLPDDTNNQPVTTVVTNTVSNAGTFYVPLGSSGSTRESDWVTISTTATEIDWSEYGSNKAVTWEAYAKVFQGNGAAYVRLYDTTNNVAVPGSEMLTQGQEFVHLKSGTMTPWAGVNTYVVQVKSLTGYEAFYEGGKIKIVVS